MMIVIEKINLKELYDRDDNLWLEETVKLLKENRLNELDLENLIEELESLAKRDKLAMASLLEQVIRHLLLIEYWHEEKDKNYAHWQSEIVSFRTQINRKRTKNLDNYLKENIFSIYKSARKYVVAKSQLDTFPQESPYTLEQLLDEDWFPEK
jgi:hypothetical protein